MIFQDLTPSYSRYKQQHYLVIRPIATIPPAVEPYLPELSELTALDGLTLKQKFTGRTLQVLKINQERTVLERIARELQDRGFPSAVFSKEELSSPGKPGYAASLELSAGSLQFISPESEAVLILDGSTSILAVLGTANVAELQRKRMARFAINPGFPLSLEEILQFIYRNSPIMDLFSTDSNIPVRIDSAKFNFTSLGEANRQSVAVNFAIILKEIRRFSSSLVVDTGFGENRLPFINWSESTQREPFRSAFTIYSHFISLAFRRGLLAGPSGNQKPSLEESSPELDGIIWVGPLRLKKDDSQRGEGRPRFTERSEAPVLAPAAVVSRGLSQTSLGIYRLIDRIRNSKKYLRSFGPTALTVPLGVVAFISLLLAESLQEPNLLAPGLLSAGLICFFRSFVLIGIKRDIENCPTSKIRSLAMGQVEVKGYARQKYYLKAPYSLTDCVYYSYKVYEQEWTRDGYRYQLKETGDSGLMPFYLEDDTGSILLLPGKALIHAGKNQNFFYDPLTKIFGVPSSSLSHQRKIVEKIIPVRQFLYVMGFARPFRESIRERKNQFIEKIKAIKHDPKRLKRYDKDFDGVISQEEWDQVRADLEEKVLMEGLPTSEKKDYAAIGEHPLGGLFYISDRKEEGIIKSFRWKILLYLILGAAGVLAGSFYLQKLLNNKILLQVLNQLFLALAGFD